MRSPPSPPPSLFRCNGRHEEGRRVSDVSRLSRAVMWTEEERERSIYTRGAAARDRLGASRRDNAKAVCGVPGCSDSVAKLVPYGTGDKRSSPLLECVRSRSSLSLSLSPVLSRTSDGVVRFLPSGLCARDLSLASRNNRPREVEERAAASLT